jgi:hypothetical protein
MGRMSNAPTLLPLDASLVILGEAVPINLRQRVLAALARNPRLCVPEPRTRASTEPVSGYAGAICKAASVTRLQPLQ